MKRHITRSRLVFETAALLLLLAPAVPAVAQDVPGIELCTRESRLDRRTGCLQSNVEYLQQLIAKNAIDTQQRLAAASRDITALKGELAAASAAIAGLTAQLAELQSRLDRLQKAPAAPPSSQPVAPTSTQSAAPAGAQPPAPSARPDSKPAGK